MNQETKEINNSVASFYVSPLPIHTDSEVQTGNRTADYRFKAN